MSLKLILAAGVGLLLSTATASAYDQYFNFNQVWDSATAEHRRDEALSATPRDAMRHHPGAIYRPGAHDPSGRIILEGAM